MHRLAPSLVIIFGGLSLAAAHADGTVQGTVKLDRPRPVQLPPGYTPPATKQPMQPPDVMPAVVCLENATKTYPASRSGEVLSIVQQGYQFRPAVAAVQTGASVIFPNQDSEFHNVFSYSPVKRFDLGRFRSDEKSPLVTFDKPGVVKVYCEIHKNMRCILFVLDTPWFVTTDERGRFELKGIPAGDYVVRAILPSEKTLKATVRVGDGATSRVELNR